MIRLCKMQFFRWLPLFRTFSEMIIICSNFWIIKDPFSEGNISHLACNYLCACTLTETEDILDSTLSTSMLAASCRTEDNKTLSDIFFKTGGGGGGCSGKRSIMLTSHLFYRHIGIITHNDSVNDALVWEKRMLRIVLSENGWWFAVVTPKENSWKEMKKKKYCSLWVNCISLIKKGAIVPPFHHHLHFYDATKTDEQVWHCCVFLKCYENTIYRATIQCFGDCSVYT